MRGFSSRVLSCLERERLAKEFSSLSRLRQLTDRERMAFDEGEQTAQARHGARWSAVKLFYAVRGRHIWS